MISPVSLYRLARSNPCLITGCRLVIEDEGKSLWGDLHMQGDMFVFVGANSGWEYGYDSKDYEPTQKTVTLMVSRGYFERRNIVVLAPWDCNYSQSVVEHFERWLNA